MNRTLTPLSAQRGAGLATGTAELGGYVVRAAGPADADAIRDFVCGLSVKTQFLRFFTAVAPPSGGLLRILSGAKGNADVILITDERGLVVGHGMAVDLEQCGTLSTDVGLVIADRWQGQGLGTTLLSLLTARATERGVTTLVLDILPTNLRMLGIITRRWPDAQRTRTADAISVRADITPRAGSAEQPTTRRSPADHSQASTDSYRGVRREPARSAA